MRTLPSIGKLKLAGKNISRLGTQFDRRLAAQPSVMESQDQALGNLPLRNLWRYNPRWFRNKAERPLLGGRCEGDRRCCMHLLYC